MSGSLHLIFSIEQHGVGLVWKLTGRQLQRFDHATFFAAWQQHITRAPLRIARGFWPWFSLLKNAIEAQCYLRWLVGEPPLAGALCTWTYSSLEVFWNEVLVAKSWADVKPFASTCCNRSWRYISFLFGSTVALLRISLREVFRGFAVTFSWPYCTWLRADGVATCCDKHMVLCERVGQVANQLTQVQLIWRTI